MTEEGRGLGTRGYILWKGPPKITLKGMKSLLESRELAMLSSLPMLCWYEASHASRSRR